MPEPIRNYRLFAALVILGSGAGLAPLIPLDADPFSWRLFRGAYSTDTDLAITKDDGVTTVAVGDMVTYTIEASNAGPDPAIGATVTDNFPAPDLFDCSWTCVATGSASCPAGPVNGDIGTAVDLPVGDLVTFTATCTVSAAANGMFVTNEVTILAPAGAIDPDPGNNTASDIDTMVTPVDLMSFEVE